MASFREQVATRVRVLLAERGMTVSELARRLGRDQKWAARRIPQRAGTPVHKALDTDELAAIADVLKVEVVELLPAREAAGAGGSGPPPRYRPEVPNHPEVPNQDDTNSTYFSVTAKRTAGDQPKAVTVPGARPAEITRPPTGPGARHGDRTTGPASRRPRVNARLAGARP